MTIVLECFDVSYYSVTVNCINFLRFLEAAESGDIGKNGIFTIEEASTKLGSSKYYFHTVVGIINKVLI